MKARRIVTRARAAVLFARLLATLKRQGQPVQPTLPL